MYFISYFLASREKPSSTIWPFNEMKIQRGQSKQGPSESSPTRPAASFFRRGLQSLALCANK